jgi:hypothetical protein
MATALTFRGRVCAAGELVEEPLVGLGALSAQAVAKSPSTARR